MRRTLLIDDDFAEYIKQGLEEKQFRSWSHAINYVFKQYMKQQNR